MTIRALSPDDVKFIVVHCSASLPNPSFDVKTVDRWHRDRGFIKVGYHFVIKTNGEVQPGRLLTERGAHASDHNHESVGICLIGGVDSKGRSRDNFTSDQYAALANLLIDLRAKFPQAEVLGHRDLPNVKKDCPCFDVRRWVKETIDEPPLR